MTEKHEEQPWQGAHEHKKFEALHEDESASAPEESPSHEESWSAPHPEVKVSYGTVGPMSVQQKQVVKKTKKVYTHSYTTVKHQPKHHTCPPIVCDPQYVFHDCYVPREVPVIHPIIHVQRHHIVNIPKHYYQSSTKNTVVDPGCPGKPHTPNPW